MSVRDELTPRARETLDHLLRGCSEKEIARQMKVSEHTVHNHVRAVYRAHAISSRGELMARYVDRGSAPSSMPTHIDRLIVGRLEAKILSGPFDHSTIRVAAGIGGAAAALVVVGLLFLGGTARSPGEPPRDSERESAVTVAALADVGGAAEGRDILVTSSIRHDMWTPVDRVVIGHTYSVGLSSPVLVKVANATGRLDGSGEWSPPVSGVVEFRLADPAPLDANHVSIRRKLHRP